MRIKLLTIILIFLICGTFSFSKTFKEILKNAEQPNMAEVIAKKPKELNLSSMKITIPKSARFYVMFGGNTPIGVFIEGGKYTYTLSDKYFLPVAKRNFKSTIKGKFAIENSSLIFKEKTRYIAVWSYKLGKKYAKFIDSTEKKFPKKVKKVFDGMLYGHPSLTLLFQQLYPKENFITVYTGSRKNKLVYAVNPVYLKTETLFAILPFPFKYKNLRGKYRIVPVATHTLKKSWLEKDKSLFTKTVHTEFNLLNDKKEHIILNTKQKVEILKDNTPAYVVELISHIYQKRKISYYNVKYIKVNGEKVDYAHLNHLLIVKFNKPLNKGDTVEIETETEGNIALMTNGMERWSLGLWAWYPKPRHNEESSTFLIKVTTRKPYVSFAPGKVLKRYSDDKYNYLETYLSIPGQYPVIASGKYKTCSEKRGDYKCVAACYSEKKETIAKKFIDIYFTAINFYSNLFKANYPFKTQFLVEGVSRGQAPPGIIFFSRLNTYSFIDTNRLVLSEQTFQAFAHEIAHGYWGHIAKIPNKEEIWISEALCQFSSLTFITTVEKNRKEAIKFRNTTLAQWKGQAKMLNKGSILYFCSDFSNENPSDRLDRSRLLYAKGPLIFISLGKKLIKKYGERKGSIIFTEFLRRLLKEYRFKNLYTEDLINTLNNLTGTNWQPWFEKMILTEQLPDLD